MRVTVSQSMLRAESFVKNMQGAAYKLDGKGMAAARVPHLEMAVLADLKVVQLEESGPPSG